MKRTRNDAVKAAVASYLERRNYPVSILSCVIYINNSINGYFIEIKLLQDIEIFNNSNSTSRSAEEMAVATIVQCESSRANSILFSCINNDSAQYDVQYTK